jgi:hypothetical protein
MEQQTRGDFGDAAARYTALLDACAAAGVPASAVLDDAARGRLAPFYVSAVVGDTASARLLAVRCGDSLGGLADVRPLRAALHAGLTDVALAWLDEYLDYVRVRARFDPLRHDDGTMRWALRGVFEQVFDAGDTTCAAAFLQRLVDGAEARARFASGVSASLAVLRPDLYEALRAIRPSVEVLGEAAREAFTASAVKTGDLALLRRIFPDNTDLLKHTLRHGALHVARSVLREGWGWGSGARRINQGKPG